jgi:hypothetical protein
MLPSISCIAQREEGSARFDPIDVNVSLPLPFGKGGIRMRINTSTFGIFIILAANLI